MKKYYKPNAEIFNVEKDVIMVSGDAKQEYGAQVPDNFWD